MAKHLNTNVNVTMVGPDGSTATADEVLAALVDAATSNTIRVPSAPFVIGNTWRGSEYWTVERLAFADAEITEVLTEVLPDVDNTATIDKVAASAEQTA